MKRIERVEVSVEPDRYMTYDELSEMLSVPKGTLYSWVHHGTVPHVRFSKRCVRFRLSDIEAWICRKQLDASRGRGSCERTV